MNRTELTHLIIAFLVLTFVISLDSLRVYDWAGFAFSFLFAFTILALTIGSKMIVANSLDAGVEHRIWYWGRFGWKPDAHLKKEIPLGVIVPLVLTIISLGLFKVMTILTFETTALKRRAARRFGHYSFTEMTDWHTALVGASGIIASLLIAVVAFVLATWMPPLATLSKMASFYAFYNILPISKLDGAQIFFGSRVLFTILAIISLLFAGYALFLP